MHSHRNEIVNLFFVNELRQVYFTFVPGESAVLQHLAGADTAKAERPEKTLQRSPESDRGWHGVRQGFQDNVVSRMLVMGLTFSHGRLVLVLEPGTGILPIIPIIPMVPREVGTERKMDSKYKNIYSFFSFLLSPLSFSSSRIIGRIGRIGRTRLASHPQWIDFIGRTFGGATFLLGVRLPDSQEAMPTEPVKRLF